MRADQRQGLLWNKSSYSGSQSHCVEVAVVWRKSTYSTGQGGNCVEVADLPSAHAVRDSKWPELGALLFTTVEWDAFVTAAKANEL